ncbi:MAG: four helix bundle protein [Candidatus Electryonea clarkiae]|nr:four helix bundle protein [Candidatus Electryonea clarkiae]MDP8287600.1 four helix bundle protein [Candidatus Electryonea clarkiae]
MELGIERFEMKENVIQDKSYTFALRIIKLYKYMVDDKKEYVLSKQILRCGTSIGANIEEAIAGQSKKDFNSKMYIAFKEARETHYWLRLLRDSHFLTEKESESLFKDNIEIVKLLSSITLTMKETLRK